MPSYQLNVNGQARTVDVSADTPLLWVLRDHLDLVGTKYEFSPIGLGEPTLPPAGGAIANGFKAATGRRIYNQPFSRYPEMLTVPEKEIIG